MSAAAMISLGLRASIFLCVLVLGLRAPLHQATHLFRHPRHFFASIVAMDVVMPAVAVTLALVFDLHPAVKIALVALSVSPVPPFLPQKELKAGGNDDFAIGLLAASAALSVVIIPAALGIITRIFSMPIGLPTSAIMKVVIGTVLAPLIIGMGLRVALPELAARALKPLGMLANGVLALAAIAILISQWRQMLSLVGDGTLASLVAFSAIGTVTGHALGGPERENRTVLALSTAGRHPAVAATIARASFPDQKLVLPAVLLALIVNGVVTAIYLAWFKHHPRPTPIPVERRARA